jgi:hypothetical protein
MRFFSILILVAISLQSKAQDSTNASIRVFNGEQVSFQIITQKIDWEEIRKKNPGWIICITSPVSYRLNPNDSSFKILSFTVSSETQEGYIYEVNWADTQFSGQGGNAIRMAAPGKEISFYNIKAIHKSGITATLKPLVIRL